MDWVSTNSQNYSSLQYKSTDHQKQLIFKIRVFMKIRGFVQMRLAQLHQNHLGVMREWVGIRLYLLLGLAFHQKSFFGAPQCHGFPVELGLSTDLGSASLSDDSRVLPERMGQWTHVAR